MQIDAFRTTCEAAGGHVERLSSVLRGVRCFTADGKMMIELGHPGPQIFDK